MIIPQTHHMFKVPLPNTYNDLQIAYTRLAIRELIIAHSYTIKHGALHENDDD